MHPEEQRVAIAEWCGFVSGVEEHYPYRREWAKDGRMYCDCDLPDYANDLNAMHEAETKLFPIHVWDHSKPDLWCEYTSRLDMICIGHAGGVYRATAAQRAEALLKTIGKWNNKTAQSED